MSDVLELPARPDTPEARAAGESVLRTALAVVGVAVALAMLWLARGTVPVSAEVPRPLPFAASWSAAGSEAWQGGAVGPRGVTVAASGANGAVASIAGGQDWRDYTLRARIRWLAGSSVALHVRESGPSDFVACVLEGETVRIEEVAGGVTRTLASAPAPAYAGRAFDAVVAVSDGRVSFTADGVTLASARLARASAGTAGLAVWDPAWDKARLSAEYVRVEAGARHPKPVARPAKAAPAEAGGSGE